MMQRMRIPMNGPQAVSIVLALAIGWQLTAVVASWLDRDANPPPSSMNLAPSVTASSSLGKRSAAIRAAALFGVDSQGATPVQSELGWALVGVIAETDPGTGRAILGENTAATRVYAVGDSLPGGRRLHAVYPDRVLLERGGLLEELRLPRLNAQAGSPSVEQYSLPVGTAETAGVGGQWADLLRWQAVTRADQSAGLRVYPGANARLFSQAGLSPGDLILAINGTPLADPANAEQFLRILTGAPQATLTLERGGRTENILINLASLELAGPT